MSSIKISADRNRAYQVFEGFGASGAWWAQEVGGWTHTDSESRLPVRDRIAQLLYSKSYGIGLRTYRYNIGGASSQSGKGVYSMPLRRTEGFEISEGKYDFSRDKNAVYMMNQAVKNGAQEVILFVNSPIERLTVSGMAHCDKKRPFMDNIRRENYRAFAKYCLDVTEHFVKEGLPVRYLSPINEPVWIWNGGQEGCHYSPRSAGRALRVFAREMDKRPMLDNVRLSGLENGDIRWFNKSYTRNLFKYEEVRRRVDSVDIHSYFLRDKMFKGFLSRQAFLKRFRKWMNKKYPFAEIKMSEWTHMQGGRDRSMRSALVMANVIYEDISILNAVSWQHWIAVSEVDYCDGLIYINLEDKSFEMTKRYYATGNFSRYIPYGARRIGVECADKELKILAFEKDGRTVFVVINDTDKEKKASFPSAEGKKILSVVTDDNYDLAERECDDSGDITITPESVSTFIF